MASEINTKSISRPLVWRKVERQSLASTTVARKCCGHPDFHKTFLVHTEDDESSKAGFPLAKSYTQDAQRTLHQKQGPIQSMPAMWAHPSLNSCCRASNEFMRLMVRVALLFGAALSCWMALLTPNSGESEETTWVIGLGILGTFCSTDSLRYMSTAVSLLIGLRERRLLLLAKRLGTLS